MTSVDDAARDPSEMHASTGGILMAVDRLDRGGLERVVATLALGIRRRGHAVSVLCWRKGGHTARDLEREGLRVYLAHGERDVLQRVLDRERPRALGSHWADEAVLEAAAARGIPVIEHIHNSYIWLDEAGWARERQRSGYFGRALAVSSLTRRYYLRWNADFQPSRLACLANGIPDEELVPEAYGAARARLGVAPDDFLIVSLGGYDGIKNQLGLLAAFDAVARRHPQARLVCAGSVTNREYFGTVRRLARTLEHRGRIRVWGFRADAALWLAAADLYAVASFAEGWSLAATEALAAGVPLVHTECGGGQELVGEGARGLRVPNPAGDPLALDRETFLRMMWQEDQPNRDALAEAIAQMIVERRQWHVQRGRLAREARESFGEQAQVEGYLQALGEIAAPNSAGKK